MRKILIRLLAWGCFFMLTGLFFFSLSGCNDHVPVRSTNWVSYVGTPNDQEGVEKIAKFMKNNLVYFKKDGLCYAVSIYWNGNTSGVAMACIPCPEEQHE